jgi:hypothetical protein
MGHFKVVEPFALGSNYLSSLSRDTTSKDEPVDERAEAIASEFYGRTNPMAANWAGSKHAQFGYLDNLKGGEEASIEQGKKSKYGYVDTTSENDDN